MTIHPAPKGKRPNAAKKKRDTFTRVYGGPEYLAFVQSKPCCACHRSGNTEAAHSVTGGTGRKADAKTLVPLCGSSWPEGVIGTHTTFEGCHRELHRTGITTFEQKHGVSLTAIASQLWAEFHDRRDQ